MSIKAQLTARPRRRPRALSDRRDQEPLLRPGPRQARRRPYSRGSVTSFKPWVTESG